MSIRILQQALIPLLLLLSTAAGRAGADEGHSHPAGEVVPAFPDSVTNAICPVTGDSIDTAMYVDHEGRRIYFCCNMCRVKFRRDPGEYMAVLGEVPPSSEVDSPHDHETDHAEPVGGLRAWIGWLGKLHPMVIHFPIAFALAAFLADLLFLLVKRDVFEGAARYILTLGGLSALLAAPLGWAAASTARYGVELQSDLFAHRWLGTAGGALLVVAWVVREWSFLQYSRPGNFSRVLLAVATVAILGAGFFGGNLVFGPGHLAFP